jgi:hypothetical protein
VQEQAVEPEQVSQSADLPELMMSAKVQVSTQKTGGSRMKSIRAFNSP